MRPSSPTIGIAIRPTTLATRHDFAAVLHDAMAWQEARGSQGWLRPFDDAWMLPRIERGELFSVFLQDQPLHDAPDEPVAVFRLLWEDRPFWGERETGDSVYLHTFAVRRSKAGLGIGAAVIEAVAAMGRERGRASMRLDCFLANARLIAFYERNGFASVGTILMENRMMNLMERGL